MKKFIKNIPTKIKSLLSLRLLFPEYINPNEKLSYEIREKLSKNHEDINGKNLDKIISERKSRFPEFYFSGIKKNVLNFSDFKSEILSRSLGINDEFNKKAPSFISLVNSNFSYFSFLFKLRLKF